MTEKSVREMSFFERKRHSLEARTFRTTVVSSIVLGLVLLVIGLALYGVSLTRQYVSHAFYLSQNVSMLVSRETDCVGLADRVMTIYRGLSDEERAKTGSAEYRAHFSEILNDREYEMLLHMLPGFTRSDDVSDVYLAMYDEKNRAMVYIVDPNEKDRLYPGEWESVTEEGMQKFLRWNGEGMLYDIDRTSKYGWMCTAGTPIRGGGGEISVFLLVDVTIEQVLWGMHAYALQIFVALVIVITLLSWIQIGRMKRMLVRPINEIAESARDYVKDRRAGVRDRDHFSMLNIRTGDEVENLSLVMADMERDLTEYEENLTRITAEKERISTELTLATRIQKDMLPGEFPAFPDRREFEIFASMDPAREVGGDFYNYFLIDDDHLCLMIADVSGKGVPAALFMMASMIILADNALAGKSPARILADTNAAICSHNREEMFVTAWLGILELSTGTLTAANAGHEYPALKRAGERFALLRDRHGFIIGGMADTRYADYELRLRPGDKLFVYTDGVPEASDTDGAMFGTERMLAALNEGEDDAPEKLLGNVRRAVDGFVKGAEQFDDLTMLCLEYRGKDESSRAPSCGTDGDGGENEER